MPNPRNKKKKAPRARAIGPGALDDDASASEPEASAGERSAAREESGASAAEVVTSRVAAPRSAWLLAASGALALVLGVAALMTARASRMASATATPAAEVGAPPRQVVRRGAWGELRINTILLQPPVESVASISNDCSKLSTVWSFPGWDAARLSELGATLFDPQAAAALQNNASCTAAGCTVVMPLEARAAMLPTARQRLYTVLGKLGNDEFSGAIKLQDENVQEWLESALARPEDRELAKGMFYRDDGRASFADAEAVCLRLSGLEDRRRFIGALFASEALLVHLRVHHGQSPEPLLAYWRAGHRRLKNIEPMLRSLALEPQGGEIDLSHLLPSFARRYLYTFPPTGDERLNCHWTTLNFDQPAPNDAYLDDAKAAQAFSTEFAPVEAEGRRYGDAVTFSEPSGALAHSAIYLADDILFTKDGRSMRRPWALLRLDEVRAAYPKATVIRYLRRRSVLDSAN